MQETYMKEKPIFPLLMSLALPMVISMLVNALYNIVDSLFIAKISEDAFTALSLVFPVQNFINSIAIGFGVGINAMIALHLGAGNQEQADRAATQGLVISLLHGLVLTAVSIPLMPVYLRLFTDSEQTVALGVTYASIVFSFSTVLMASLAVEKILQSVGRMKLTMAGLSLGAAVNIVLDPVLIFGWGPIPALGIAGAALATGIGQTMTVVMYLLVCPRMELPVHLRRRYLRPQARMTRQLYGIGIPAILNLALPSLLVSFLNGLLAGYSQSYVVVLGIYYKLQTFLYMPANGIVQGMRPLIGYNYGAGEQKRVKKLFDLTLGLSAAIMAAGTVVCRGFAGSLMGLFTANAETLAVGEQALRCISMGFLVSAVSVTACGALEGLGKGTASLVISLVRYTVVIMPTAWLLCRAFGVAAVWHAFWITEVLAAAVSLAVYRRSVQKPRSNAIQNG
ncbi:MATE family efflux transporter [uncultured Gemmiger sp.]|uniref:MATE family efflux transporter n=1 Tax=uncultured Gemmiger sp. TaxID=1623490 RepID=UPI0025F22A41|nr:MATE family efflux transporter [uncultured Gemmiger sp.]